MQYEGPSRQKTWKEWATSFFRSEYDFFNPEPFTPPKFEHDDPKLAEYFKEHGYAVVKGVADENERAKGIGLFWDLCESGREELKRDDPNTWGNENWVADPYVGIMSGYGIGQSQFLWYARTLPKVKQAFSHLWETDDLLVSFDGCGVFRPPEQNPMWRTEGAWYHIDQNLYLKQGLHAIQGLVNFYPSGPNDGGFVVVPRSTHMVNAIFEKHDNICSKTSGHFVKMYPDASYWKDAIKAVGKRNASNKYDMLPVKLVLDAGDMVLWDSRAIHCSHPPTKNDTRPEATQRLKRLAAYVCMTPTRLAKNIDELAKYRVFAFQRGITTTHWPHEFFPSSSERKLPGVGAEHVKLTPEQATLITGKGLNWDVYDKSIVENVDLRNLKDL